MLSALPNPILYVQLEGVRELDGREALSGLWTLFSKCKESIDGGRRLENISWRLWYRDMLVTGSARSDGAILKSRNPSAEDECLNEKAYRPPTPMESVLSSHSDRGISRHQAALPPLCSGNLHPITPPAASQSIPRPHQLSTDSVRKPRNLLAVGQIICEMLPSSFEGIHSPATSPRFISLSMSPSSGGATRIPRSERLSTLPASLGRSDLAGSHLHISGSAFLPLVPLLPLPEPNSTLGTRIVAPSQLPTPGTEEDESAPFVKPALPCTPDRLHSRISAPSIPSRYQDTSFGSEMSSSVTSPNCEPECLAITGPPSPSLSDSYVRAHPGESTTVDHLQGGGVPGIKAPVQSPNLSQPRSDAGVETYNPHSLTVSTLDEDTPVPIVATPPRLVVVNPTPGPTPHPTPPATPLSFLASADNARLRPHGQFLAPPARMASQQLAPVPAPVFNLGSSSPAGDTRGPTGVNLDRGDRSTAPLKDSGRTLHQVVTESRATPSPRIQSTPPTQDQTSVEEARRPRAETTTVENAQGQVSSSHNPNRLSTSSTASTSSTGGTTTSTASSSSRLSVGATSVNTDVSSGQRSSDSASSDGLKTLTSKGPIERTLTQDSPMKSPVSPVSPTQASPSASTSVTSVKSAKSAILTGARLNARPGLARRASSGGGGRSRKPGNLSTVNRATSNSSGSRSRSRDAVSRKDTAAAAGALAATMGMTTVATGGPSGGARKRMGAKMGGKGRIALARTVSRGTTSGGAALKRTLSHEEVEEVTDENDGEEMRAAAVARELEQREKEEREREAAAREATAFEENEQKVIAKASRAKFKFGSNSDNGSNAGTEISSRAPGSEMYGGYDVKGKGRELDLAAQERHTQELKERELAVQRAREGAAVLERERQAKQEQARKEAEAVARARAHESLADPLLPQANKRTILLTSESDYTDTDDESWTSEDVEEGAAAQGLASRHPPPNARQPSHPEPRQTQHHAPPVPQQHPPPPLAVQRTHSNTSGAGRTSRREWQHIQQRREAQLRIQKAAAQLQREEEEKQRQRDMFTKKPTTSFQNLTELQRNRSTGLLTQLMNPDPTIFPPNHPYRRGHSSGEIQRMGMTPMTSMTAMSSAAQPQPRRSQTEPTQQQQQEPAPNGQATAAPQPAPAPAPPIEQKTTQLPDRQQQPNDTGRTRAPPRRSATLDSQPMAPPAPPVMTTAPPSDKSTAAPPSPIRSERRAPSLTNVAVNLALRGMRTLGLATGKGTTAGPMASQVMAGSVTTKHAAKASAAPPPTSPEVRSPSSSNGYRPKGPLPGQEMDSDSEDEGDDTLQFSKSVAQDRLKQFAARRGIVAAGPSLPPQPEGDEVPGWAREEPKGKAPIPPQQPVAPPPAPGPIPVMHPYNLPVNAVPSTPRTTRRQMLRNEMSESLRRQLLWERQQAGVPIRRTTSTGHVGPQRVSMLNGIKPLTTTPSMVQLHAKGTTGNRQPSHLRQEVEAGGSDMIRGSGERERRGSARPAEVDQEARRQALARNRSWTNEYHTSGW